MKLGLLADIHSNERALDTALRLLEEHGVDEFIVAGDAVYEYRHSEHVVRELQRRGARLVLGNHEEGFLVSGRGQALAGTDEVKWLREQTHHLETEANGRRILIFHSTPWTPRGEYLLPGQRRFQNLGELDYDIVIYGHTHWQCTHEVDGTLIVNPGSVGEPRDHRNGLRGSVAVLDTSSLEVQHLNFDIDT